jgi:uncharacterized protein YaaN involved in tellurite resistance
MGDSLKIGNMGPAKPVGVVEPAEVVAPADSALALVPPQPAGLVDEAQATGAVKLDAATLAKLDVIVAEFVVAITQLEVRDPRFRQRIADIQALGGDEIKASAQVSSRLLARPVNTMKKGSLAASSTVGSSLLQLRRQIDALDPGHQGDLFGTRKLLGWIPFGDRLAAYLAKYQSSQSHINAIVAGLQSGQQTLVRDNEDLEQEKANLWEAMARLRQYIYLAQKLDSTLEDRITRVEGNDPERARILREDMLFYVRQKVLDLTVQLSVSVQGYLAMDIIRRNNLELIRGVDRATTTTISALRTAVIVTQALGDQKLVLDQVTALNTTTSNLIESTSTMLRTQSAAINQEAAASTIDVAKLQAAFDNVYATLDEIDAYKLAALDAMTRTSDALKTQIDRAQPYIERALAGGAEGSNSGSTRR